MSWEGSLGWSLLRAQLVVAVAGPLAVRWHHAWHAAGGGRPWRGGLLATLFLCPELLIGYAYAPWVAGLPLRAEMACAVLLIFRVLPVGMVALALTPPPTVSASARHAQRWMAPRAWRLALRLWWSGPAAAYGPAWLLMGLVAFQEFELAALLKAVSWTDWLFVQQVGGLSLTASLRLSVGPIVGQLAVIGLLLAGMHAGDRESVAVVPRRGTPRLGWGDDLLLIGGFGLVVLLPLVHLLLRVPEGLEPLLRPSWRQGGLIRELVSGTGMAVLSSMLAWGLVGLWPRRGPAALRWLGLIGLVPGLLGSLLLGLGLVALFQQPGLRGWYGTPGVWLIGQTLWLLPRAVLLRRYLEPRRSSSEQAARQLAERGDPRQQTMGRRLLWRLIDQPRFFGIATLVWWAYLDLTTAYLLAPVGMSSGVVRLYNFMHFGRTAALSAEAAVLLGGPLLIGGLVWLLARGWRR